MTLPSHSYMNLSLECVYAQGTDQGMKHETEL